MPLGSWGGVEKKMETTLFLKGLGFRAMIVSGVWEKKRETAVDLWYRVPQVDC